MGTGDNLPPTNFVRLKSRSIELSSLDGSEQIKEIIIIIIII
jgi:hypothetical protein